MRVALEIAAISCDGFLQLPSLQSSLIKGLSCAALSLINLLRGGMRRNPSSYHRKFALETFSVKLPFCARWNGTTMQKAPHLVSKNASLLTCNWWVVRKLVEEFQFPLFPIYYWCTIFLQLYCRDFFCNTPFLFLSLWEVLWGVEGEGGRLYAFSLELE